ncbi:MULTISPECIES: transposase [Phascolarctobacterium]
MTKYMRKMICNELREDIKEIIKDLCNWKGIKIIEGQMMAYQSTA